MITNIFNLSFKKQNLVLEKDKTKENSKNNPDIAKAVGKRKTPKRFFSFSFRATLKKGFVF